LKPQQTSRGRCSLAAYDKITLDVDRLCSGGLKPQDIAILSLRGAAPPDSIAHKSSLGRHTLVRAADAGFEKHVVAETFLRFKGLERPVVIVYDLHLARASQTWASGCSSRSRGRCPWCASLGLAPTWKRIAY